MSRFLRPEMKVTDGGYGHKGIIDQRGVWWGCGKCGTKNAIKSEACVLCRCPNFRVAPSAPTPMPSFVPRIL